MGQTTITPPIISNTLDEVDDVYDLIVSLELCTGLHGPNDPRTIEAANRLALGFLRTGEDGQAVTLLLQILDQLDGSFGNDHPMRADILGTLAEILFEQAQLDWAAAIQGELLESLIRRCGANHPSSLRAKGHLAIILFELGQIEEAAWLEQEAFEAARTQLGKAHPVASVLAWNRVQTHQRRGDMDSVRSIVVSELIWLLAEDSANLEKAQITIRTLLSKQLNWDRPVEC